MLLEGKPQYVSVRMILLLSADQYSFLDGTENRRPAEGLQWNVLHTGLCGGQR